MPSSKGKKLAIKWLIACLAFLGLLLLAHAGAGRLQDALGWIAASGSKGLLAFVCLYAGACVLFVPGSALTLGAGAVFGLWKGTVLVSLASTLGATLAFILGRTLARDRIAEKVGHDARFRAIDEAVGREGWKIVLLTRLSPAFPFSLLNYALGLTQVPLGAYVLASWIGMLPGTLMYVYLGSLAGGIAGLKGPHQRSASQWALYGVGLLATVTVTVFVTRVARRALRDALPTEDPKP